ncbi:MAG: T9SS type A sorting domain-containing protein [Bacteroidales bacterium]|nr:T9SS type A sorting domain-containing protein [Bacteroidales bacterium]
MIKNLKTLAFACLTLIASTMMGQNINLKFTGTFTNGDYIRLDSVKVENLNSNWTETLVYPDTVLSFNQTGISGVESSELELQSYPNPFNGKTSVRVSLPQSGNVTLQIHNLAGQKIAEAMKNLNAGEHIFGITLKNTELNLLTIKTTNGQKTIKLLNNGSSVSNSIIYNGMGLAEKRLSTQNFQVGDVLRIAGYASVYGIVVRSREILQSQTASENFTLFFETANYRLPTVTTTIASNITDGSAVSGGNVTDSGGLTITARGICWDTATNPTISNSHTTDGTGFGSFTSNITGLLQNTTYHVRAYATNAVGTAYGNDITFTTMASLPTVTTTAVSNITDSSGVSGGNVVDNGGASVTARGICWDTATNPTISDNHTTDSNGNGTFTSNITGLLPNTTYHVRAYATNTAGTAYGAEMTFTTMASLPTVTTTVASNITDSSAVSGGNVTYDGGAAIIARGVCWDTSHNPTTSNSHTNDSTGVGAFTSNITGLLPNTTYYVRAYATNAAGTAYGAEITFVTDDTLPEGALSGVFSIGTNRQIRFSKGNLQWSANGSHTTIDSTAPGTWRFAEHQWNIIGAADSNISSYYTGWIDLFGWGTSGYNNKYPYMISYTCSDYVLGTNISGTNYDWGVYNAISNGGNTPGLWRTITYTELDTLLFYRNTFGGVRYAKATVNGTQGLLLCPDDWDSTHFNLDSVNSMSTSFNSNVISLVDWNVLENSGCTFLPAAGYRAGTNCHDILVIGCYWSSTYTFLGSGAPSYMPYYSAYNLAFADYDGGLQYRNAVWGGYAVRLIQDVF